MPKVKIDLYEDGTPAATISMPAWVVTGGTSFLPKVAGKPLRDHVDLRELVDLLKTRSQTAN